VTWWPCDLGAKAEAEELIQRVAPDVIFHLASEVAGSRDRALVVPMFYANLASAVHLLSAAARLPGTRVVQVGSMEEPRPGAVASSPYAIAKVAATGYAQMFHDLWQLPVTTLKVAMAYGPEQRDLRKLVPHVITSLLAGLPPKVSSGHREIDWVYVDDVVDALVMAALVPAAAGAVVEIGSGRGISIRDTVTRLAELIGSGVEPRYGAELDRSRDSARIADTTAARALGWQPRVPLDEGMARTVRWYVERIGNRSVDSPECPVGRSSC
jgi:nucleoside-diphosphate-sugar epimerase